MRLTETLGEWVAGLRYEDLPSVVVAAAKEQLLGILGAAYAGTRMSTADGLHAAVAAFGDREEATVIGGARAALKTSMRSAAMANSFLSQILEWEDFLILSHAGAAVVPTALAVAEARARNGRDLLVALVAGNEVVGRSGEVMEDGTNLGNAVANHQIEVALIAGKLLGLDATGLADAVGVSCTQPQTSSLIAWTAPAKGMLTGWPVCTGITAAQLAEAGVIGSHDVLDNPLGFVSRISDVESADRLQLLVKDLGTDWRTETIVLKPYPADGFIMTAIEAGIRIANTPGFSVDDVTEVVVYANVPFAATATLFSEGKMDIYAKIADRRDWTYIALQYDGLHTVAAALRYGRLTWAEWQDDAIHDEAVLGLLGKIRLVPDVVVGVWGAEIVARTSAGEFREKVMCITPPRGADKLREGADGLLPAGRIGQIADMVAHLEDVDDVRALTSLL
jgi:2-methylcitrate dehydratase PrpD